MGLLGVAVVLVGMVVLVRLPDTGSAQEIGPILLHTVTRGDLTVTVTEQGTLESADNTEIKCKVRGQSTVIWVIEGGSEVQPGDELVRLDTLAIEDAIAERTKYAHLTRSGAERARADVARAEIAVSEYLEGRYHAELMTLEKDLVIAKSNLRTAQNMLGYTEKLSERGYVSGLDVEEDTFAVTQALLNVEVKQTEIEVLQRFTKAMELETLHGNLNAAKARFAAENERAKQDAARRDLALAELEYCVIRAERGGMVIHPSAAQWKRAPEIEEGATVHKDQVLLLIPDLTQMQVKVGIHESVIDRIQPGLKARVSLSDKTYEGTVSSVAPVTRPAGWWTGNVVKYDTIVALPAVEDLRPGMTVEVEVIMVRHENVVLIPVAAVLETVSGDFCWVRRAQGSERRRLELGDTDDAFVVVQAGLEAGDEVVLDPLAFVPEAQTEVLIPLDQTPPPAVLKPEADHVD